MFGRHKLNISSRTVGIQSRIAAELHPELAIVAAFAGTQHHFLVVSLSWGV
jgi:hypothetical protein